MRETFCVLFLDHRTKPPAKRLSIPYDSIDAAFVAARALRVMNSAPLQVRGSEGTIVEQGDLDAALRRVEDARVTAGR